MNEKLLDLPTSELLKKFGAGNHTPGSGSAAAFQGMLSARLLLTVISLTKDPKRALAYAAQLPNLCRIESALECQLLPNLTRLFHEDSAQFDRVIHLRKERERETDALARRELDRQAISELMPATEIPIQIAKDCLEIAEFALQVFDQGFKSASGDSGVAINAALSAVSGSLSIVELNLLSFEANDWTNEIRSSRNQILVKLDDLMDRARERRSGQVARTERKSQLSRDIQSIALTAKGKRPLQEFEIENLAKRLQEVMWEHKDLLWTQDTPKIRIDVLKPEKALKCFGILVDRPVTLGQYFGHGVQIEVAGQIDQHKKIVSISQQFSKEIQSFTAAHELGHYLLHTQPNLHRDRPLDGARSLDPRGSEEWQADKFATHFLMPKMLVKEAFSNAFLTEQFEITEETAFALKGTSSRAILEMCKRPRDLSRLLASAGFYNSVNFRPLAQQFQVSIEAMAIRLEELELIVL